MSIDDYAFLAALVAYRDRLQTLANARLNDLSNREALARQIIVMPLPNKSRRRPIGPRLLPRLVEMVETAAAVPSLAPRYFDQLIAELLHLHNTHKGNITTPDWEDTKAGREEASIRLISQMPNKEVNLARWALREVHWLKLRLLSLIHPVERIKAGMEVLRIVPGWIWHITPEACACFTGRSSRSGAKLLML